MSAGGGAFGLHCAINADSVYLRVRDKVIFPSAVVASVIASPAFNLQNDFYLHIISCAKNGL